MKNVNFDSLTNIKAPDAWIENALNIPKTVDKKKPVFFIKHARTLAAVACLVFVSVISVVIFLSNDKVTVQIDPDTKETKATISSAQTDYPTQHNEKPSKEQSSKQENKPQRPTTPYEAIEPPEGDVPQKPTTGNTDTQDPPSPTATPKPTEPVVKPPTDSTEKEDENPLPTEPCLPPEATEPEGWPPVEPGNPGNPGNPGDPVEPTVPDAPSVRPTEKPIEPTENPFKHIGLSGSAPLSAVENINFVYCMIYDSNGHLIGDSNLYSSQHRAHLVEIGDRVDFNYIVPDGLITKHDTYTYYFYDRDGVILYVGTKKI
ncbi:MAG: hypothetical protein IJ433_00960 [Ruminococcus sp.]|nr:hypothetical protein [Ruminococcus sp.]